MHYIYTPSFRKDRNIINWLFVVQTKSMSHFQIVHIDINKLNDIMSTGDNIKDDEDEGFEQLEFDKEDDGHEDDEDSN